MSMAKMNLVYTKPWFFPIIKFVFPEADWDKGVIITYGKNVYTKGPIPQSLIDHEQVHVDQQRYFPTWWVFRYLTSMKFRLQAEIPAHRAEYQALNREQKRRYLDVIAGRLSGPLYNNMISLSEARELILHEEKESN